jgi:hypothetical protein
MSPSASRPKVSSWPWLILLVFSAIELLRSLSDLSVLFDDVPEIPGTTPGGLLITASILIAPILAAAALAFALRNMLGAAIIALAGATLVRWIRDLPSIVNHWADPALFDFEELLRLVILPALAVAAIVLAWRGQRLGLATAFAILPTLVDIVAIAGFIVLVSIYGF